MTWKELKDEVEGRAKAASANPDDLRIRLGVYDATEGVTFSWANQCEPRFGQHCLFIYADGVEP